MRQRTHNDESHNPLSRSHFHNPPAPKGLFVCRPTLYLFTVVDWYFANGNESKYADDDTKRRSRPTEITFPKSSGSEWFVCWHLYKQDFFGGGGEAGTWQIRSKKVDDETEKRLHFHNPPALDQKTAAAQNYPDVPLHKTT